MEFEYLIIHPDGDLVIGKASTVKEVRQALALALDLDGDIDCDVYSSSIESDLALLIPEVMGEAPNRLANALYQGSSICGPVAAVRGSYEGSVIAKVLSALSKRVPEGEKYWIVRFRSGNDSMKMTILGPYPTTDPSL